ncbi:MAG TPA: 2'-deoxycytidine 5'-triphosphate deaminase [Terriglobales bacterium]|jgi:dCTP deaminase|nr:2'-deoxycytidine 5'-triphosphate deaminase [Terriglobales bacterium]
MSTLDLNSELILFPELEGEAAGTYTTGILPSQEIKELIAKGQICASPEITDVQIQPASLDLRLGDIAHRVQASFLPRQGSTVEQRIQELRMTRVDLTGAAVLEKGCVYIVPLIEELNLPKDIWARANPKSTTGRLDIFTRLITDHGIEFEYVPPGYKGRLYAEIVSRTFTVHVRAGMRLSQLRFVRGNPRPSDAAMSVLNQDEPLVYWDEDSPAKAQINRGLLISVNLQAHEASEAIAYKAKKNAPSVDLGKINHYSPEEFWDVKHQTGNKGLILDPGDFYILASKERISVPPQWAAEMGSIDPSIGEFRIHYAGFFDPGFGYGSGDVKGTRAVLEVRAHDVPFLIEDGQIVGRLTYMRLLSRPDKIYGTDIGSSYQRQALTLSKQFKKS